MFLHVSAANVNIYNRGIYTWCVIKLLKNLLCANIIRRCFCKRSLETIGLAVIITFDWLNDVTDLQADAFAKVQKCVCFEIVCRYAISVQIMHEITKP